MLVYGGGVAEEAQCMNDESEMEEDGGVLGFGSELS